MEAKEIAALAQAQVATIAPQMYCGPVGAAAAAQVATSSPNFLIQEFNTPPLHADLLVEPLLIEDGFILPPTWPGLGVELNEKVVRRHLVT